MYTLQCTVTIVAGVLNITWVNGTDGNELIEGNGISFNSETMSPGTVQRYDLIFNRLNYYPRVGVSSEGIAVVLCVSE